jgi:hypothetical protein
VPFVSSWPRLEATASSTASQAATATAAASTAGLLVLGGGGSSVAAAAAAPAADGLADGVPYHAATAVASGETRSAGATQVRPDATGTADGTHRVVSHQHESTRLAPQAAVVSTDAQVTRGSSRQRPASTGDRTTTSHPKRDGGHAVSDPADTCTAESGHAYGHEHAPGWQKNWGEGGRHPGDGHGSESSSAGDPGSCA